MSDTIPLFKVFMNPDTADEVGKVLNSGMITQSSKVEEYEARLKAYFNYPYVVSVNSATSGLILAGMLSNLGPGDEVITTSLTCFATTAAILANKCRIVWADVNPNTCNIDLNDVKQKITKNTKALCFVHWGGTPVDMCYVEEIIEYSLDTFGISLAVIEDCAHAFGAEYIDKKLGTTFNTIAVYSTQAIKHLTTADGGIMLLPTEELYERAKLLRWYGIDRNRRSLPGSDFRLEPNIPEAGGKYHMNDVNATIGLCNLRGIDDRIEKHRENADYYNQHIHKNAVITLLEISPWSKSSYWIYTLKICLGFKQEFMKYMTDLGITVSQVHARNDKHTCVSEFRTRLPNLDTLEKQIVSIPVGWWITPGERAKIVNAINQFSKEKTPKITLLNTDTLDVYKNLLQEMNSYLGDNPCMDTDSMNSVRLLYLNDELVGSGKLLIEQKLYQPVGHIEDIVISSKYRGRGIGKYLVKELDKLAKNTGCYKTVLVCKPELEDFYANSGFTYDGISMVSRH